MNRLLIGLLFGIGLNAAGVVSAHALEFEQKGNTLFVTGSNIDFIDVGRFENALANGADTFVFYKIGGSRIDVLEGIGRLIQKAGITTVAADMCGPSCAYLFLAGKQRRYGTLPGTAKRSTHFLALAGAVVEGSSEDAAYATETYSYFKNAFGDGMPRALLNKYTTQGKVGEVMVFALPSAAFPEGNIHECVIKEDKKNVDCKRVQELTPVSVGALTSAEPFVLTDENATKPPPTQAD